MRPLTAITGILLGSCLAITVSLAAVLFVFIVLSDEYPRVDNEFRPLLSATLVFLGMTAISALSFYTLAIRHQSRYYAVAIMFTALAATIWYFWP